MMTHDTFPARVGGIHASTIVPMREDYSVDLDLLARHIADVTAVAGIRGLLINGHAGENFVLSVEEKISVLKVVRQVCGPDLLIVSGVNAESSLDAAGEAAAMEAAGADGLLVFPPNSWALGHAEDCVMLHHQFIARATGVPLMLYLASVGAGRMAYPPQLLARLLADPRVLAIKEGSWEVATYEENLRVTQAIRPDVAVLGSGDEHLLTSYLIGSAGSQVSLAAVVPELVVALWQAAERQDWGEARVIHNRIYPLAVAIYRDAPGGRATARLKCALQVLGRLPNDVVRPPQPPVTPEERARIGKALAAAGL